MNESVQPFHKAVEAMLIKRDCGLRELQRRTQRNAGWGALSTIGSLLNGQLKPSFEAMEHIAQALEIRPEYFAEYRLEKRRRELDPEYVGLSRALKNLG